MPNKSETALVGRWILHRTGIVADDTCQRIESLVLGKFIKLADSIDGWSSLFQDPSDGRLWERTYPQSAMHGGGLPRYIALAWNRPEPLVTR